MHISQDHIAELRTTLKGRVIGPQDADYHQTRAVFYGGIDRRPALIAAVADASDVAQVIRLARANGLELAVRGGGHSVAGHSASDGGIVLDLRAMKALTIEHERRSAWAEAGLTAGEYTAAVGAHGLATGFGDTASVGIGGITLGGGIGYLVRKYGLTIDSLLAAEIVTADGELRRVDPQHEPKLFWAIRGGGGNFGVVTRFHFRLHPVECVVGGMLLLPATPSVIAGLVAQAEAAPEELSMIANVMMPAPPLPFVPVEQQGRPVVLVLMAYAGDSEAGQRAIAPFRALATPIADLLRPLRYSELFPPQEEGYHPLAVGQTLFMDTFDHGQAEAILEHLRTATAKLAVIQVRVLGGAVARVPVEATAFAHRQRRMMVNVAAQYERPDEAAHYAAWTANVAAQLRQGDAAYVNFLGDEGPARVRDAYPGATWERLQAIKRLYDPTNLFRRNHNIPPAPGDARV